MSLLDQAPAEIDVQGITNPHLRRILRRRLCRSGGHECAQTYTAHTDWADKVYGDGYADYYNEHTETTYSDHYDEPRL